MPIVISVPHSGRSIPEDFGFKNCFEDGIEDCDLLVDRLYDFALSRRIVFIKSHVSRYVVDLNRPINDEALYSRKTTGLCPVYSFNADPIYQDEREHLDPQEQSYRIEKYYKPYHLAVQNTLAMMKKKYANILLYDAHSIARHTQLLAPEQLPDLILGTNDGASCSPRFVEAFEQVFASSGYSFAVNAPFKGGHITRSYAQVASGIHCLQLERCKDTYLDDNQCLDDFKTRRLSTYLQNLMESFKTCLDNLQ